MSLNKTYKNLLYEVTKGDCPCPGKYCFLIEMIEQSHKFDHRFLFQMKCLEIYKFNESKKEGKDIGWDVSLQRWVLNGYAEKFAEFYSPTLTEDEVSLTPLEVYKKIETFFSNKK